MKPSLRNLMLNLVPPQKDMSNYQQHNNKLKNETLIERFNKKLN